VVELGGGSSTARPASLLVRSPDDRPIRAATVDGAAAQTTGRAVFVSHLPARIVFDY